MSAIFEYSVYIPLTNRVRGPYCKLRIEFLKKRGSVTYSTDRENEVSKIFIISLRLTGARARKLIKVKRKVQLPQRIRAKIPKTKSSWLLSLK